MNEPGIFVTSMGIVSPLGKGLDETLRSIERACSAVEPLQLFTTPQSPLPVGEVTVLNLSKDLPRTHVLALIAAEEALQSATEIPDAIVIGTTTGGMTLTEEYLKQGETDPFLYRNHAAGSVAETLAERFGCRGPVLTVSTACSSGVAALKIALELIRSGKARRVLAGGVDALCRLTYYGFHSLQLVDPTGAHPFDQGRKGMSVGEGAAMLVLTAADDPPKEAFAELLGGALTCDAYHPAAPHPQGEGARRAMVEALADAGVAPEEVDYIHLHGTGTTENDLAEGRAIQALFGDRPIPPLSSLKGAWGHALGAAGTMGAVVTALAIQKGFLPANIGLCTPDPAIGLVPVNAFQRADLKRVLVNAFGFGGNNAVAVLGRAGAGRADQPIQNARDLPPFYVHGRSCLTAAGDTARTLETLQAGMPVRGVVPSADLLKPLSERAVRRLKRLSRMVLSLAVTACEGKNGKDSPRAVFFGTRWGGLSETHDFLTRLFAMNERFTSPIDFIGSVHNAPAGQAALHFHATGPNLTITGGEETFEQTLFAASLLSGGEPLLLIGADEYNEHLSPLFDPMTIPGESPADGGGALYLKHEKGEAVCTISPVFTSLAGSDEVVVAQLVSSLGGAACVKDKYGLILAGMPTVQQERCRRQRDAFLALTGFPGPLADYRRFLGEFASAAAVATVFAVSCIEKGVVPAGFGIDRPVSLAGRGILILGFGKHVTALEVNPC